MIGLDTNVLVRYIMQDDAKQAALANKLIEGLTEDSPGYISLVVIVELVWVLESAYDLTRQQVTSAFCNLLSVNVFKVDRVALVASALRTYAEGMADVADCLIERSSALAGCRCTMTFGRAAAKTGGMVLIK
ncbi:MAG: PIN domain-containing protein [Burkholderiales bacterium]